MPVVRYTAKRSLVSPVVANDTVTYNLPVAWGNMTRSRIPSVVRHRSLTGAQAAYYHTAQRAWDVTTKPMLWAQELSGPGSRAAELVMFLDSVESGEQFEFDPDHVAADGGSIVYLDVVLDSDGYSEPRRPELDTLLTYSFRIITVP